MDISLWTIGALLSIVIGLIFALTDKGKKPSTEANLDSLRDLSKDTAIREPDNVVDPKETALHCAKVTGEARRYSSRTLLSDFTDESLKPNDYVGIQWRMDFVRPDRYHVTQDMWDTERGEPRDQWVSIGKENYQNAGVWYQTEDGRNDEHNHSLVVDDLLQLLINHDPITSEVYRYGESHYLLIEYRTPIPSKLFRANMEEFASLLHSDCSVHLWIDLATGFLAKGEMMVKGQTKAGEGIHISIQQVFTNYNEFIKVNPPPWLNAVRTAEGNLQIVERKLPLVRHHP